MAYVWQRWLEQELREALEAKGYRLIVVEGWENRGRPASTGHFDPQGAHTKHHTGAHSSASNPIPTLRTLIVGRPDLGGPLAQVATAYNGDVYLIAAGRANHAGGVGKSGVVGMPLGADGNALAIGDEVDTDGTQRLPAAQIEAMDIVSAVILQHFDRPVEWVHRHQDISGTGKWDIGNRTTKQVRDGAGDALDDMEDDMFEPADREKLEATLEAVEKLAARESERAKNTRERDRRLAKGIRLAVRETSGKVREQLDAIADELAAADDQE